MHQNFKDAIVGAGDDGTVLVSVPGNPTMRVLRNVGLDRRGGGLGEADPLFSLLGQITDSTSAGKMDASVANTGQVSSRIDAVLPVADVIRSTWVDAQTALTAAAARL